MSQGVLIIGAGPTGLTLACELLRRGVPCRIIDKLTAPVAESRAFGIQARTLEMLEDMGIVQQFLAHGQPIRGGMIKINSGVVRIDFSRLPSHYPFILLLGQSHTEKLLTEHLAALEGTVERNRELIMLSQDQGGVNATIRSDDGTTEEIRADWLVGCDGAHSITRKMLGVTFQGEQFPEQFTLADVHVAGQLPPSQLYLHAHPRGLFGLFGLSGNLLRIIATNPPLDAAGQLLEPSIPLYQHMLVERGPGNLQITDAVWMSHFRIHHRVVDRLRVGRCFLAGDAAHIHSPAGGQGMNTGMQDVYNLAWKLALVSQRKCDPRILDSYERERLPIDRGIVHRTTMLTSTMTSADPLVRSLRDHLAPLITAAPIVRDVIPRTISQLNHTYHDSPIIENHPLSAGLRAGQIAPDAVVIRSDSTKSRLVPLLGTGKHTLLAIAARLHPARALAELPLFCGEIAGQYADVLNTMFVTGAAKLDSTNCFTADESFFEVYGHSPRLYLIRPDRHIGFRCPWSGPQPLREYLARLFA